MPLKMCANRARSGKMRKFANQRKRAQTGTTDQSTDWGTGRVEKGAERARSGQRVQANQTKKKTQNSANDQPTD